jgi:DNA polymerase-4
VHTIAQLAAVALTDLLDWFGQAHGAGLYRLARADDDRVLVTEREAKSVSAEETFGVDLTDRVRLHHEIDLLAARVGGRIRAAGLSGRTVTLKIRHYDFTTISRSLTRDQPTDDPQLIAQFARRLLTEVDTSAGIRLLGVGVTTLTDFAQDDLFTLASTDAAAVIIEQTGEASPGPAEPVAQGWRPGQDVRHDEYGPGWVWGSGLGRVTVRFEGPGTAPGPIRTFAVGDPRLYPADPPDWTTG